jgi:general secretion pathway protein E
MRLIDAFAPPPAARVSPEAVGALLQALGHCDAPALERGRRVAAESAQRLDHILLRLGLVGERELAEGYARLLDLPVTPPSAYPDAPVLPELLKGRFLRAARAVPLARHDGVLALAVADPLDRFAPRAVAAACGDPVRLEVAVPVELEAAFERLYPEGPDGAAEAAADAPAAGEAVGDDAEKLRDLASEAPVIRLVNQMLARAVEARASDIHIEPFEDRLRLRFRLDGMLHEIETLKPALTAAVTSRVKIMARLDIAERRLPQDGRIVFVVRGQEVDFRVSTLPSLHGETIVLRVLDRNAVVFDYARLGLAPDIIRGFTQALDLPNGIVLVTGPVGSGKTTTLYTGLLGLNAMTRKIVTVEDPVEYQLRGITQAQVKPQIGLTFASLLRAIVRQDPNVIMVGEIRDLETAQIAVQAASTGRLVLSTLHTNSAVATIVRLRDMGLEDYQTAAVLRGVLAQRLVRRLCLACRAPADAGEPAADGVTMWRAVGCADCHHTGYRGRIAIAEFLRVTEPVRRLIFARAGDADVERAAVAEGMTTLAEAGAAAVRAGGTTPDEVLRSIRAEA